MPLVTDRSICLRKTEYSETSQILTLFTREYGLLRVIAKGAHRRTKAGASKFGGGLDLLDVGNAVFTHDLARDLSTLCEWGLTEGHLALRKNLRGIYLGLYSAELVSRLIEEHDPHPNLFDRLEQTIPELAGTRREETFLAFQLDLLREAGYLAELTACVSCGVVLNEKSDVSFSGKLGGAICFNCEAVTPDRVRVDARLVRLINGLLRLPRVNGLPQRLPQLTRHQTDPINRLFADQVAHTLGRGLRLPRYVLS